MSFAFTILWKQVARMFLNNLYATSSIFIDRKLHCAQEEFTVKMWASKLLQLPWCVRPDRPFLPQIAHVIREIRHFQQTPYKIEHNPRVTAYLLDPSLLLSDDNLYRMSLDLEPRRSTLTHVNAPLLTAATSSGSSSSSSSWQRRRTAGEIWVSLWGPPPCSRIADQGGNSRSFAALNLLGRLEWRVLAATTTAEGGGSSDHRNKRLWRHPFMTLTMMILHGDVAAGGDSLDLYDHQSLFIHI